MFTGGDGWLSTVAARLESRMGNGFLQQSKMLRRCITLMANEFDVSA